MDLGLSPSLSIGGIDCRLYHGEDGRLPGIVERWPQAAPEAEAVYTCRWEDRYAFVRALRGSSAYVGGVLVRTSPHAWFESPNMYCDGIGDITPLGVETLASAVGLAPAGWVRAADWGDGKRYAVVPAHYSPSPFAFGTGPSEGIGNGFFGDPSITDASGQAWTTTTFNFSGQELQAPNSSFFFQDGGPAWVPVDESLLGILRPKIEISVVRHFVPNIRLDRIKPFIGKVNVGNVGFRDLVFPPGFLLFGGFKGTKEVNILGEVHYSVEYGLLGNVDYSWNYLLGKDGSWHLLSNNKTGTGEGPFLYEDFANVP